MFTKNEQKLPRISLFFVFPSSLCKFCYICTHTYIYPIIFLSDLCPTVFYSSNLSVCQCYSVFLRSRISLKWCQRRISVSTAWVSAAVGRQSLCFLEVTVSRQIGRLCFVLGLFLCSCCVFFQSWLEQCVLLRSFSCNVRNQLYYGS